MDQNTKKIMLLAFLAIVVYIIIVYAVLPDKTCDIDMSQCENIQSYLAQ
jgi:hypothetical protein